MNRLASTGVTADPWGFRGPVPRLPSGIRDGGSEPPFNIQHDPARSAALASTAFTMKSHGTESNDTPAYYRYRGPRRRDPGVGEGLAAHRGRRLSC